MRKYIDLLWRERAITTILLVVMCMQITSIEGYTISPIKVMVMSLMPVVFFYKTPCVNKALIFGWLVWVVCFFFASIGGYLSMPSMGYWGLFILSYIVFYGLLQKGAFTIDYFQKLLHWLILFYGIVIILQQLTLLLDVAPLSFANLDNKWLVYSSRMSGLAIEPSHAARLLMVLMLSYLRCLQIKNDGKKVSFRFLFSNEHRVVTILFLWAMLTMRSATAFMGLYVLSIYFINRRTVFRVICVLGLITVIGPLLNITHLNRAVRLTQAVVSGGTIQEIKDADASGAVRAIAFVNMINQLDLSDKKTWFGSGRKDVGTEPGDDLKRSDQLLSIVENYGLIAQIISFLLVYGCAIRRFFSIENLIYIIFLGMSIGSVYYIWATMMIFTAARYLSTKRE